MDITKRYDELITGGNFLEHLEQLQQSHSASPIIHPNLTAALAGIVFLSVFSNTYWADLL